MTILELKEAISLIEKFNSKYEDITCEFDDDFDLKISDNYFNYNDVIKLEQAIIEYKKIFQA